MRDLIEHEFDSGCRSRRGEMLLLPVQQLGATVAGRAGAIVGAEVGGNGGCGWWACWCINWRGGRWGGRVGSGNAGGSWNL